MLLESLREVLWSDYKGPRFSFSEAQVIKALIEISKSGVMGRTRLGSALNLGQGETRTLIRRLKEANLIVIESNGCELTEKGKKHTRSIRRFFPWDSSVDCSSLRIGKAFWAIIARNGSKKVRMGIEQRDAAIKTGASTLLTLFYQSDKFVVPMEQTDAETASKSAEPWKLLRKGKPREGDAILICGADNLAVAEYGAWSAALTLLL